MISVIVPVYNTSKYLPACIDSILAQSYKDYELILVDDGSTDNSGNICDEYAKKDKKIKVIHQENGGISAARNAGLSEASGDYICFVDSDDFVAENFLEALYNSLIENNAEMSMVYFKSVNEEANPKDEEPEGELDSFVYSSENLLDYLTDVRTNEYVQTVIICNKLFVKSLFEKIKFPTGILNEDEIVIHKLIDRCANIAVTYSELYYYRMRSGSITHPIKKIKRVNTNKLRALRDRVTLCERKYPSIYKKMLNAYMEELLQYYPYDKQIVLDDFKAEWKRSRDKFTTHEKTKYFLFIYLRPVYYVLKRL